MRESCISHKSKSLLLLIREDYFRLTKCDKILSALLAVFEYWANGEISKNPMVGDISIDLGIRTIAQIEELTLWIATDKLLRTKIKELEQLGFISTFRGAGNQITYTLHIAYLQRSLDAVDWSISIAELRSQNTARCCHPSGLLTEPPPVNEPHPSGLLTEPPPVNEPHPSGLLTEPLYIEEFKNFSKEIERSADAQNTHSIDEIKVEFEEKLLPINPPVNTNAEVEFTHSTHVLPLGSDIAALENDSQRFTSDRIRQTWEQTGILPKIPMELDAWAVTDIGQEVISTYRRSGRITTAKRGDIVPEFALYVASQNPGKDVDYGYTYIKKLEADPKSWETLAALVLKWQVSKGSNRNINIAHEVKRKPLIKLNLNKF